MYTTPANLIGIVLAGAGAGVLGAILGTGGGIIVIPFLVIAMGVPMHYAVATSIVSVIATSCAVASANVERGTANMRLGMTLEIATTLGAIAGGLVAGFLPHRILEGTFAAMLVPTGYLIWRGRTERHDTPDESKTIPNGTGHPPAEDDPGLGGSFIDDKTGEVVRYQVRRLWGGLGISFLAGNVSGLLGIGGGIFKVPALNLVCGVPIKAAAATSNFMIGVTAAASAFLYYGRGEVRPALTAAVVLGVLAGSSLGSVLNRYVDARLVQKLFAVLLLVVAIQMAYRAARGG